MTDFYMRKETSLSDYTCDQTIITKKRYLKHLSRVNYEEDNPPPVSQIVDWYPFTNSYYPYTEDVDAFARVNHLLGSKPSFESLTSIPNFDSIYDEDSYSEKGAQLQYLTSNPISFLILGKPGIGEQELGKLLADYWKCVYIDPETLINEEIEAGTRAGQCIEFNLRSGRAIGTDVIIRLLEKRIKSKSAKHRGFVICGFPLIPNDLYEEDPVSSESAVFNVREIFEEIFDTTIEVGVPPQVKFDVKMSKAEEVPGEQEQGDEVKSEAPPPSEKTVKLPGQDAPLDVGSIMTENICETGDLEKNFEEQINFIFSQFSKPFVVIYITCSNTDVVSKHRDCRFDVISKQVIDLQREHSDKVVYTYFSRVPGANDELPEDFIDVVKNTSITLDSTNPRQLVTLPRDFSSNMVTLLDRYRYSVLPVIERHVLMHDIQYFIKVDGRISPVRMFSAIKTKLRILPLQKVVLPEKLLVPPEPGGEGGPADEPDIDALSFEECFELFRKKSIASPMFKWGWSDWGTKCPVSMKEGGYKDGNPKLAVHFMNKIFFLSDEDAYLKFCRNPRPYLLPPYPKSSCKIFVMGPKCSGKTAVSNCLGYLLRGEVLEYNKLENEFFKVKLAELEDKIRYAALQEGITLLNKMRREEWERKEAERQDKVEIWLLKQQDLLQRTIAYKEYLMEEDENVTIVLEMSSFPVSLSYNKKNRDLLLTGSDTSLASLQSEVDRVKATVEELKKLINFNGLPGFHEIELCEELLADREKLLDYLPPHLLPPATYDVEPATIFDDFVRRYADDAVNNASFSGVELTPDVIAEMLIETIREVEDKNVQQGNNKGGWILDGIPPNEELFDKFQEYFPDDIYLLKDTADYDFLLQRFETKGLNEFRDYRGLFMDLGKPEVAWRSPSLRSTRSYKARVAQTIMGDILDDTYYLAETKVGESESKQEDHLKKHPRRVALEAYKKDLSKFDEDWENIRDFVTRSNVNITEILVTNKSLDDLLKEVVRHMENSVRQVASIFTAEDRVEELEDFGEPDLQGEELGEAEEKEGTEDMFFQNRRFGDTFNYCPVAFHDHWVLWKGKEENAAKFENKLYLMSSEEAMDAFVEDPRRYLLINSPPPTFPPPRICIVGPNGSGKTTITRALCKNLGLYNINYGQLLKKALAPKSSFEIPEILKMGIAGSEGEMVEGYFASDLPLPEEFLNSIVLPPWSQEPIKFFGFVFDGFPKRPSDIEYMTVHYTIPDIIVELTITEGDLHQRLVDKFIEKWQDAMNRKQEIAERKHKEKIAVWKEKRQARYTELMELRKEQRYIGKLKENEEKLTQDKPSRPYLEDLTEAEDEADPSSPRYRSEVSYDSVAQEADDEAVNIILAEEIPEPVFEEPLEESLEEAVQRFAKELEDSYGAEMNFFRIAREECESELIPWITVDAGMSEDKVFAQVMRVVDKYKFCNNSLFERSYDISVELADKLLSNGYYFLSKFGKTCPVQIYENINPVQMFLPLEQKFQLFPVIHRHYIYFLAKKENCDKFKEDPLKYISQKNYNFPLIPLKLAIIGPPKSGKTELAERFKRDLGMKVISRGQAGRYVLRYLEYSELAKNMESVLQYGWELTSEMMIKCVEALSFDGKSITQGFVLDGFPSCIEEVRHLAQLGLVPHLVIDLQAEHADIYEFISTDKGKRGLPVFSKKFIDHRYEEFLKTKIEFREWLDGEYQTLGKIPVKLSKWGIWTAAYELATAVFSEIKHYFKFARCDLALRLGNMQVTPLEFIERQSIFKHYCPCCLHYDNILISGGDPPDRTGLVQFRKFYYYLCHEHIDQFIDDPEQFIEPYNKSKFPTYLPVKVNISNVPDDAYEDGVCIVCYWENIPKRIFRKGNVEHAVTYKEKIYLFDRDSCMNKFMKHPCKYYAKVIHYKGRPYPSLNYNELPILGLLQQYDSKQLLKAIVNTATLRPMIPGLTPSISAAINIGLYLKTNNPRTPAEFLPLYEAAKDLFHERRTDLINYLAQMKRMINPYLYYDEPLRKFIDPLIRPSPPLSELEPDPGTISSAIPTESQESTSTSVGAVEKLLSNFDLDD
ncbi:hypothetical protein ILUMI_24223 [Ignelater luminosus]|uniref:Adenylate kinase 9 n=1 Tax=Ignelater luminosus TaxID=2038154 RepID=A0A8K0CDV0_IGNLU|nr:hypothetical protein ILUMI_24223 [Ignelater luminosus]